MMLATLLLALQPAGAAPEPRLACQPRVNLTAGGRPPAVLSAQRLAVGTQARIDLSVHRCPDGGFRVERRLSGRDQRERREMDWLPAAQCPAIGRWLEAATRLRLPSPMLRPHGELSGGAGGTWYTLTGRTRTGAGFHGRIELEILDPPGAAPNVLGSWFDEGARLFQACRDRGHGGEGWARTPERIRR
ncbi:MAG TPA: hypothetical protein VMG08_18420 [Allosphingosinicella sp.]|nr:hypothetical protein [Allosphingosinicella sp.]